MKKHTINLIKNSGRKFTAVFSVATLFVLLHVSTIYAQENDNTESSKSGVTRTDWMIKSTTTDKELYDQEKNYNNDFGLSLKFKKISRNKNQEITALKIHLSNDKGIKKVYDVSESEPIKPFTIFVDSDANSIITFGFGDARASLLIEENEKNQMLADLNVASQNDVAAAKKFEVRSEDNDSAEILGDDDISVLRRDKNIDYKKAYISLNGKEISASEMEKIDPKSIGSLSVLNNRNNDKIVEKYGEKAHNGAIIIESMFVLRALSSQEIKDLPNDFKLDSESGAFIIHKESQPSDLEFYEKKLAEIGVTIQISGLERSANGFITAIKIKLHDELKKTQMSDWVSFKNANGIVNILVGRKNDKVNISTR